MKHLIALLALALPLAAADAPKASNTVCPISGKPVNPSITYVYEDVTYAFAEDACRTKFISARENSLYHKLGGKAAIDAAVEHFLMVGASMVASPRDVGEGIKVARVADPFGNVIGLIENPHFAVPAP